MIDLDKYAGHTPGPWDVESYGLGGWDIGKDGAILASRMKWTRRSAESEANGRLIADAPALLDEVKRLRWLLEQYGHDPDLRFAVEGW